jgi:hypothetical protein
MRRRLFAILLLLYVAADFSNPMMPGAVSFDPSASVDGVRADRARADDTALPPPVAVGPVRLVLETAAAPSPLARARITPLARTPISRLALVGAEESSPPTEDD